MSRGDEMIEDGKFHLILEFVHYIFQVVLVRQCVGNCGTLFVDVCFCDAYAIEEFWQNGWRKHLELFDFFLYHSDVLIKVLKCKV